MKVMTLGWLSVFFSIFIMNVYIWHSYWRIPFKNRRTPKRVGYSGVHLLLVVGTIYYFYLFFNGRTDKKLARPLSYVAGYYLTFLDYSLLFYLVHDLFYLLGNIIPYPESLVIWTDKIFFGGFIIFGIAGLISFYSLYNSNKLEIKKYDINLAQKDSSLKDLNIVFISDGHIGTSLNRDNIDEIIDKIEKLEVDLLLLGGDFLDEGTTNKCKRIIMNKLGRIKTKYGIYAIEGNHEYKSGKCNIDEEMDYYSQEGIRVLRDEKLHIENKFYLLGRKDAYGDMERLDKLVEDMDENLPVILLDHRPSFKESKDIEVIDLQLSGHTHSGQFLPMKIFNSLSAKLNEHYIYGKHRIGNLKMIVSSGLGNWGVPVRVGSKREIVNINIEFK